MHPRRALLLAAASVASAGTTGCASVPSPARREEWVRQVRAAEIAFALTMARRDLTGFARFVSEDAVFVNGGSPLRGKAAIVAHWQRFFDGPEPPFSWKPEIVEVGADGTLGYTEGPVSQPSGTVFARFYTTWQRVDERWQVVFDNGYPVCKA